MRLQIADIIALFLPDPKQFVYTGLESSAADREYGKLLLQIVTVDNPEFFHRVRGSAVLPMRTHVQPGIPKALLHNVGHIFYKNFVCFAHAALPLFLYDYIISGPVRQGGEKPSAKKLFIPPKETRIVTSSFLPFPANFPSVSSRTPSLYQRRLPC